MLQFVPSSSFINVNESSRTIQKAFEIRNAVTILPVILRHDVIKKEHLKMASKFVVLLRSLNIRSNGKIT
jgi:hypothetical protein